MFSHKRYIEGIILAQLDLAICVYRLKIDYTLSSVTAHIIVFSCFKI